MSKKEILSRSFVASIPIMCSYLFVSMAYGIMMEEAGFAWYYSLLTITLTALLMNSRQTFYSLSFTETFKKMGKRKLYMIHTMTDETYAVNCSLELEEKEKQDVMFWVAFFSRCYWMIGAVIGGVMGQLIPFQMEGIDFCMTALFVIIFMDQWEKSQDHSPALIGLGAGTGCLLIFKQSSFMLPSLLLTSGLLFLRQRRTGKNES